MPLRHKSAQKRARQAIKHTEHNKLYKSKIRTAVKKVLAAKTKETGVIELKKTTQILDRIATKGVIHKNNAANKKSRLARFVNTLK